MPDCDEIVYSTGVEWWLDNYIILGAFPDDDFSKSILRHNVTSAFKSVTFVFEAQTGNDVLLLIFDMQDSVDFYCNNLFSVAIPEPGKPGHIPGKILVNYGYCLRKLSCDNVQMILTALLFFHFSHTNLLGIQ